MKFNYNVSKADVAKIKVLRNKIAKADRPKCNGLAYANLRVLSGIEREPSLHVDSATGELAMRLMSPNERQVMLVTASGYMRPAMHSFASEDTHVPWYSLADLTRAVEKLQKWSKLVNRPLVGVAVHQYDEDGVQCRTARHVVEWSGVVEHLDEVEGETFELYEV